jgi:dTDP-L-rhamnose 4-epimerase
MTRVLVTGGAGFIGSHTVDALLARGYDVRVLDLLVPPVHNGTVPSYLASDVEFIHGDVRDPATVRRALRDVHIVYHMAAYQDYLPDFSTFFTTNSAGTALLYELVLAEFRHVELIVVASSQAVYGEGRYECAADGPVYPGPRSDEQLANANWDHGCPICGGPVTPGWTDEQMMNPHTPYGLSKRDQDDLATRLGRRYLIPSVALRYSIVQGPRQSFRNAYSGALRSFTVELASRRPPTVYEDGQQLRDYVGIRDVVRANMLPLDRPDMAYGGYNVGGNRSTTVLDLAGLVSAALGAELAPNVSGVYRVGDTRHSRSDLSRLAALGWAPREDLPAVVESYVRWALASPDFFDAARAARERMQQLGVIRRVAPSLATSGVRAG